MEGTGRTNPLLLNITMEEEKRGWKEYEGKKVYLQLKDGRKYSGNIIEIDDSNYSIVFITIIDKFGKRVSFEKSELKLIQEEEHEGKVDASLKTPNVAEAGEPKASPALPGSDSREVKDE